MSDKPPPVGMVKWYNALHQVTADMAKMWVQPPKITLKEWATKLEGIAKELKAEARKRKL